MKSDIVIIGGGAGGISVAQSLYKRNKNIDISIVEPNESHYYQPGWTMVGGGIFSAKQTKKSMASVMPNFVRHVRKEVSSIDAENKVVHLTEDHKIEYNYLVIACGLKLDWGHIKGLEETLGKNGVTSNYKYDLAPYTWQLVSDMVKGKAIFTQPAMPIKCAGAPQKAMYLSCNEWEKRKKLHNIDVEFCNASPTLFGIAEYVPPLMEYVNRYKAELSLNHNLVKVDGEKKKATFQYMDGDKKRQITKGFDMLHVVPPQTGHDFLKKSNLVDNKGWVEVDMYSLQHIRYENIFSLGDAASTPNAKTVAAVRKQAPVLAENLLLVRNGSKSVYKYDGYGSCPLTVENGKVILAEFGYGGKIMPSFPWNSTIPRKSAWHLKKDFLPWFYWNGMLKGREWLAKPGVG